MNYGNEIDVYSFYFFLFVVNGVYVIIGYLMILLIGFVFFLVIRVVICDCVIILGFYGVFKIYKKDFGYKEIEESDGCNEKEGVIGKVWFLNIISSI